MRQQIYSIDELAIRFHHQLVWIHPFPNGNGRHARMMADSLLKSLGCDRFSWGGDCSLSTMNTLRKEYIDSLRKADNADYSELIKFART
jgi:fido (protein-threonine AMPylation protein)